MNETTLSPERLVDLYRLLVLIRRFEERASELRLAGFIPGFLHPSIGQEAVAVGACRALEEGDIIASTHRAHGHTLAKGTHPNELMAELYGKAEGCSLHRRLIRSRALVAQISAHVPTHRRERLRILRHGS